MNSGEKEGLKNNRVKTLLAAMSMMSALTGEEYISEREIKLRHRLDDYINQKDELIPKAEAKRARKNAKRLRDFRKRGEE